MAFIDDLKISPPEEFLFPFQPYSIQEEFMKSLYQAIENKNIGIFESPTGTGKSLSIICGTLTWLQNHNQRCKDAIKKLLSSEKESKSDSISNENEELFWVNEYVQKQQTNSEIKLAQTLKLLQDKQDEQRSKARKSSTANLCGKEKKRVYKRKLVEDETLLLMEQAKKDLELYDKGQETTCLTVDEEFALDQYESDGEDKGNTIDVETETEESSVFTKVFFCSRTHSQLSQFIHELRKSPFGKSDDFQSTDLQISVAALASRKALCINDKVRSLSSVQQINEKCLEMQRNVKKDSLSHEKVKRRKSNSSSCSCEFYRNKEGLSTLSNNIVGNVMDIEDLVREGRELKACPYYAARHSLPLSQLVVLPYQTLLHEPTRLATGIDLRESVVVIDEAHNLVEALNSMYSCQVTKKQLRKALDQLSQYFQKYNRRLKAKNLYYVKQILYVLRSLASVFTDKTPLKQSGPDKSSSSLMTLSDFLFKISLDNINLFKLLRYLSKSRISFKLSGFIEKYGEDKDSKPVSALQTFLRDTKNQESKPVSAEELNSPSMKSPLLHIESFLKALTSSSDDCRVAITTGSQETIKFLLLSPTEHFKPILEQCRSLIVAGGTMQPSSCMIDQLLPRDVAQVHKKRVVEFSCDHVINGGTQLLPISLCSGPSGRLFEFTFEKRCEKTLILDLGRMIANLINIIPGGVVCFFPSYDYESLVYELWKSSDLISKFEIKKKVFREPRNSGDGDQILAEYSKCISRTATHSGKTNGALLLSVVNGKMSEGINFSDDLGRCVIMIGLPYPNRNSPELKEKISYLNQNLPRHSDGRSAGQVHYENLCMKAVNQSIGRAIRHKNDYACLLLVDHRYSRPSVISKLPNWIGKHLKTGQRFGEAFAAIRKFFLDKKTNQS